MHAQARRASTSTSLCFAGLLIGQFVVVLDVQIVTASLINIQAGIGAAPDEISWIQTAYLIAETVGMPIGAFCVKVYGFRRFFAIACSLFVLCSLAVGAATSVETMILFRAAQGFVGGLILTLAFIFGFSMFRAEQIGAISLILAIVSVLAPTAGPVVGGYISDALGWRWIFFINVPLGFAAVALVATAADRGWGALEDRPSFDWPAAASLSLALASTLFVLEEGQREGWLESDLIAAGVIVGALAWISFLWLNLRSRHPILDLQIFRNSDFSKGWALITVGGVSLFGGSFILPLFLGEIRHYSPQQIGNTLVVSGVMMVVSGLLIMPRLKGLDLRFLIAAGFGFTGYGFLMGAYATDQWGFWDMAVLQIWRGLGIIIAITGTQTLTMQRIPAALTGSATTALYLARNLGGAVGVSALSTLLTNQTRQAYVDLASASGVRRAMQGADDTVAQTVDTVMGAARLLSYNNAFEFVALLCFAAAALSLTIRAKPSS